MTTASRESVKSYIQKKIFSELGLETSVSISDETGDVIVKRLLKVCKKSSGANQISLSDARAIKPDAKIMDYVEVDMEPNMMVDVIVNQAILESGRAEQQIRRRQEALDSLKVEGISEHSLIFPVFVEETALGDAYFDLDGKYKVCLASDRRMPNDKFTVGQEYPMIIVVIESRKNDILIQASRVTSVLVEELIRMSLIDSSIDIDIKKASRLPGRMSKVVVSCDSPDINATGIVVGNKGLRISSVERYLNGEKVEVVNYYPSTPYQIAELLGMDRIADMHFYFEKPSYFSTMKTLNKKKILAIVRDDKVGQVVGKGGSSLQLTDKISGWVIRVVTETEFREKIPEGFDFTPDFDWMGVDIGPNFVKNFYGYYLSQLGYTNVLDLAQLDVNDYTRSQYLTEGDAQFLHTIVSGLEFKYACPNCGAEIPMNAEYCSSCGTVFANEE